MKVICIFLAISMLMSANTKKVTSPKKTILERHMDFNTSYYTKKEYEAKFYQELHSKEEILGGITQKELSLLNKNKNIKKSQYVRHKKIFLSKRFTDILDALKDDVFVKHMRKKDKTSKLSLIITNKHKAIVEYPGGDSQCVWSTRYLLILKRNVLDIYDIDGFSALYAPVKPVKR